MVRKAFWTLCLFFGLLSTTQAQVLYRLPHIANGADVIKTTFILFNNSNQPAIAILTMQDDSGQPLPMDLGLGQPGNLKIVQLAAGETRFLVSSGHGDLKTGSGTVNSTVPIGVAAVFSILSGGKVKTEAGIGTSASASQVVLAVNTDSKFNTGIAIQNVGIQAGTATFNLYNEAGQQARPPVQRNLPLNGHLAQLVDSQDGLFPGLGSFKGQMVVTSTVQIAALTLRQARSGALLTTLPAVATSSGQTAFNLAQVANAATIKTQFLVFNLAAQAGSVTFNFTKADGSPMTLKLAGGQSGSSFTFPVPGNGAVFFETDGKGPGVSVGGGSVVSTVPVGVSAILSILDGTGAIKVEAGVGGTGSMTEFSLPVDLTQGFNTGLALFNNNAIASDVDFEFRTASGQLLSSSSLQLAPNSLVSLPALGQLAKYTTELFSGITPQLGQLSVRSTLPVGATGLRQHAASGLLTTLPVEAGVPGEGSSASGSQILPQTVTGVSVVENTTWNQQLNAGYKLGGTLTLPTGYLAIGAVKATDGSGRSYVGRTSFKIAGTGLVTSYAVTVPSGVWDLRICTLSSGLAPGSAAQPQPEALLPGNGFEFVSRLEPDISVFQDVTKDLTVTAPATVKVSGSVTNLTNLPPAAQALGALLVFGADGSKTQAVATVSGTSTYETHLAPGTYTVSLFFGEGVDADSDGVPDSYKSATSLLSIGSVTVGTSAVTKNFSVPSLITLTGTLQQSQTTDYTDALVLALDPRFTAGMVVQQCFPQVGSSFADPDPVSGAYSMPLAANLAYDVLGSVDTEPIGGPVGGTFSAPLIGSNRHSYAANSQLNLTVPAFPGTVTLSGKVTGPTGTALSGASVSITNTGNLSGLPTANFSVSVQTDSQGNYSVQVPPGNSYRLEFTPPVEAANPF